MTRAGIVVPIVMFTLLATGSARADPDAPHEGRELYQRWCARCHGVEADGDGRDAPLFQGAPPALRGNPVLVRHTGEELTRFVRDGKLLPLGLRPDELRRQSRRTEAVYRYLRRLPRIRWEPVDAGRELYYSRCLDCHDDYGRAQRAVSPSPRDLGDPSFQEAVGDEELSLLIRHARPGMPALGRPVDDREAGRLLAFVRLLSPGYEVYDRFCQPCHGLRGEGAPADSANGERPHFAFDAAYFERYDAQWVIDRAWHMMRRAKARMPHFAEAITEDQARAILDHLLSLDGKNP